MPQKMSVVGTLNSLEGSGRFSVEYCKPSIGPPRDDNKVWSFMMDDDAVPSTRCLRAEQEVTIESRNAK